MVLSRLTIGCSSWAVCILSVLLFKRQMYQISTNIKSFYLYIVFFNMVTQIMIIFGKPEIY